MKSLGLGYKYLIQQKYQVVLRTSRAELKKKICKQVCRVNVPAKPTQE